MRRVYSPRSYNINRRGVYKLIGDLENELNCSISSIIINFLPDKEIIRLNSEFLNHNYPTDIITFQYADNKQDMDGELFISYKEAEHNSKRYRISLEDELTRLIIHGILHLAGYSDSDKRKRSQMKKIENKLVKKYKYRLSE